MHHSKHVLAALHTFYGKPSLFTSCAVEALCVTIDRVTLIEAQQVLGTFDAPLREYAANKLNKQGVHLVQVNPPPVSTALLAALLHHDARCLIPNGTPHDPTNIKSINKQTAFLCPEDSGRYRGMPHP